MVSRIGIPDDKMAELNAYNAKDSEALYRVQTRTEGDRTHLGVINVISRLKLYYQELSLIHISEPTRPY